MVGPERAGRKVGEWGEPEATGPRADPFTPAESDRVCAPVAANILEVSEKEAETTGRMAVAGGQRQRAAPSVAAAASESILPQVQEKWPGKGGKGRPGASGTGQVGRRGSTGGKGQQGTRGR